ncbi:hypothetical protein EOD43_09315 [Sphingomonas crocodyli]|uniref:Uncharacterized protein n=2 Tax=Sphingomonas crocodyli TaxID=1979270 RepID=A0A437MC30_9SPHN|nr:hypothetical protein EOD43_09315 [Sphingomonas crocodyli]
MHIACVLALCWPAIVNRQPFYFADTTSYVRAADSAVYLFSGKRIATTWTAHYARSLDAPAPAPAAAARPAKAANGNDIAHGNVMAGRSPYFGMALWIAYVASAFWLFVLLQAGIAYGLIRQSLRLLGLARPTIVTGTVALLALLTSLPFFDALLMPDALTGFGIIAFLLLTTERGRLARWERVLLILLMAASAVAHLTHIVILLSMAALLVAIALVRRRPFAEIRPAIVTASIAVAIGMVSVIVTNMVVERTFGKEPQLVPLLTARFFADGPGEAFVARGCDPRTFAICAFRDAHPRDDSEFLWSTVPGRGIFRLASPEERRAMSAQDTAFAIAVLKAYSIAQTHAMLRNSLSQLVRFDVGINYGCGDISPCWPSIPEPEHARMMRSLSGQNGWPVDAIWALHKIVVAASVLGLLVWMATRPWRRDGAERDLALWLALFAVAMLVNAVLGGAVSEPQWRYQGRIVWILPLFAWVALMIARRKAKG